MTGRRCGCSSASSGVSLPWRISSSLHKRVVIRQAQQLAVAQTVGARVADMGNHHLLLAQVNRGDRGAHARMLDVRVGELVLVRALACST